MGSYKDIIQPIMDLSPIQKFYNNSVIFITGGTGFLGQLLLEKLLRSFPNVHIYVLVREKKGKKPFSRLDDLFNSILFKQLEEQNPEFRNRVKAVMGVCGMKDLGLSMEDRELLIEKVNIIFHVAATVRFDEKLKIAVDINIKGTEELLKISKEMKHLKSFEHVSTLFSNCPNKIIEEKFYPAALDYNQIKLLADNLPDSIADAVTERLLGDYPNTYTYTKQIAESLVHNMGRNLPIGIFRPAAVISTYKEPIRGWINNDYGPTAYVKGAAAGVIRVGEADLSCNASVVPADMTVNIMIASAWDVGTKYLEKGEDYDMQIYNYTSSNDKPLSWSKFMQEAQTNAISLGFTNCYWYYSITFFRNHYAVLIMHFLLHVLPAAMVDFVRVCIGKPPQMLKITKKILKLIRLIAYFGKRSWTFKDTNYRTLCEKITLKDKDLFFCDLKSLDWDDFLKDYVTGVRVYLLGDPLETLGKGRSKYKRLYWIHQITKTLLTLLIVKTVWSISNLFYSILM